MVSEAEDIGNCIVNPERGGLYIHIPYCRKKCIYCDFFSAGERIADWHRYIDALCSEFDERIKEMACPLRTVYIGGGTPSLIPADEFSRLCNHIHTYLTEIDEFTIEVNPDDVCEKKLEVWKACGVNRISMGIQSFNDDVLSALGRRHDASTARRACQLARNYFDNISIDLMFGLPGQTIEMWTQDLKEAISMHPEHISAYSLMYEEGTALTFMRDKGLLTEAPEGITVQMFILLIEELKNAGYEHYETSNFALAGHRSIHNSSYWLQLPYIGLGPSAHSYDGWKRRRANKPDIRGYLAHWTPCHTEKKSPIPIYEMELLSFGELIEEYVMTRMRMKEGIPLDDFRRRFGEAAFASLTENCKPLLETGKLVSNGKNISIKESEILISDSIILDMFVDKFPNSND